MPKVICPCGYTREDAEKELEQWMERDPEGDWTLIDMICFHELGCEEHYIQVESRWDKTYM